MKRVISVILIMAIVFISALTLAFMLLLSGYKVYRDLSYGELDSEIMDIYVPKKAYERNYNGCVLFIHGGSWSGGDKKEEELRCRNVANQGYIAATMNYTLYSEENRDTYNVNIVLDEIDMALEYIKNFTAKLGICTTQAATSGYSAGAHLSMLYSYSRANTAPLEIKFTANMAGPADISPSVWGEDLSITIGEMLSGKDITPEMLSNGEADEIFKVISPSTYVTKSAPPSIFIYGGSDTTVPFGNAESIMRKFDTVGVKYDFVYLPDANHALLSNPIRRLSYPMLLLSYCKIYFK